MRKILKFIFGRNRARPPIITPKPNHVAVIMDGNGRWANAQGLSRVAGHKKGVDSVKSLIRSCISHEIPYLSIFAFSSENWNRPRSEVSALIDLLGNALETQTKKLHENGVRLQLLGDISSFSERIQRLAAEAQQKTAANSKLVLSVAINYGGRWDITQACQKISSMVRDGELAVEDIDEQLVSDHLSTSEIPDPDLFIRTSGEYRLSNFMLWQSAYSEFYFTDILWPDFDEDAFTDALMKYTNRDRRFGAALDKVGEDKVGEDRVEGRDVERSTDPAEPQQPPGTSDLNPASRDTQITAAAEGQNNQGGVVAVPDPGDAKIDEVKRKHA